MLQLVHESDTVNRQVRMYTA